MALVFLSARSIAKKPTQRTSCNVIGIRVTRPMITTVSVSMIWLPVDTADTNASAQSPPNCPTIIRSTAPYMACKNRANKTGNAKRLMVLSHIKIRRLYCGVIVLISYIPLTFYPFSNRNRI